MNLLMDYIIMSPVTYKQGRFNYFTGQIGGPQDVDPPQNTGLTFIDPNDDDPLVFSCMNGSQPLALVCVVDTDPNTGTSTGKYFLCQPTISNNTVNWALKAGGSTGINLVVTVSGVAQFVAGNPHGIAQIGDYLYILGYDADNIGSGATTNIYTVGISALIAKTTGGPVEVDATTIAPTYLPTDPRPTPPPFGTNFRVHGNGLIALTDTSVTPNKTYLFAQFNGVVENPAADYMPVQYTNSKVVRLDVSGATPSSPTAVDVGKNAMGMVPLPIPASGETPAGLALAVPCLGGTYQFGQTNGAESALYRITNIFAPAMSATAAIVGEAASVPSGTTRDIKSVTFSEDGLFGYLLCVSYDNTQPIELACWKIYQTTAANILGASGVSITAAINNNLLVFLEGADSVDGNDWEVLYENEANPANGRLWFVQGVSFRVSKGNQYSVYENFTSIWADPEEPNRVGYINSADLIREMIYQYEKGHSIETRLIKGKTAAKTTPKAAAISAAAAPEEEEEK